MEKLAGAPPRSPHITPTAPCAASVLVRYPSCCICRWVTISTLAGNSCTVRPRRLAIVATKLPLSGVGAIVASYKAGCATGFTAGCGAGFAAGFAAVLAAVRLALRPAPADPVPARVAPFGFAGDTTTGLSTLGWLAPGVALCAKADLPAAPHSKAIRLNACADLDNQRRFAVVS